MVDLSPNMSYINNTLCKTASHRHRVAVKPLWIRLAWCDDNVTECEDAEKGNVNVTYPSEIKIPIIPSAKKKHEYQI